MKKKFSTINMEKRNYQAPDITVFTLEANAIMLNTSQAITSDSDGFGDLYYGGYDDEGEGD